MVVPYTHEPFTDFSVEENKFKMLDALKEIGKGLGKEYPLIVGGKRITTEDKIVSVNPANKEEIIGYVSKSNKKIAEKAMAVADGVFEPWRKSDPKLRADILFRSAGIEIGRASCRSIVCG